MVELSGLSRVGIRKKSWLMGTHLDLYWGLRKFCSWVGWLSGRTYMVYTSSQILFPPSTVKEGRGD